MSKAETTKLPATPNLPEMEHKILEFWQQTDAFHKSIEIRPKDKPYVFYDGPPFATGMPHYGHLLASTTKDVVPRYWTMKGYRVERIWGWDCHGLPIENMIEKKLDIKGGKKGIEELGVDKFNAACRAEVLRLDKEWEKIIARLGRWVDFKNAYKTMDQSYMESVWWAFSQLYKKELVYEGKKVIMYCPRCATPLSNFEIAMDNSYIEVTEPSTVYKYKVENRDNTYLLAWSTTPWNKLATPALAVNPDLTYVKVKQGDEYYILAENTLEVLDDSYSVEEKMTGAELEALTFELHFDFYPDRSENEKAGVIVADEFVTADEGTGIVTLAVYGEDDFRVMQEWGVQLVEHVDEGGKLKPELGDWAGMFYLKVNPLVDENLEKRGLIYKHESHTHSVARCYRCETRLYYAPLPAWFVNIQKLKPQLLKLNEKINWVPEHLKYGRFQKGLESAPDWNISRSRYWGTPMPIWTAEVTNQKTGKPEVVRRVISSVAELQKWAVDPSQVKELEDIHPEFLSEIEVWVDDKKTIKGTRIPEVFDCWVESGSMPFAHKHYPFQNKQAFENAFPGQFVSEYIAQTRAWFYTMHVLSTAIFGQPPFENVLTTGTILAEDGAKMSKSKKNYPDPMLLIDQYGSDSLRLYLMSSSVMKSENLNFSEKEVSDIRKNVFLIWYNMVSFYKLYAGASTADLTQAPESNVVTDVMDKWILSSLHTLIKDVTTAMDEYNVVTASRLLMEFVNEVSTWYLRRSRERLKANDESAAVSAHVFGHVLVTMAQLFAPFAPFFSDWVYQQLVNANASVHHTDWPVVDQQLLNSELEEIMITIRKVVEKSHFLRKEAGIKVRQPLPQIVVISNIERPSKEAINVLKDETNVRKVIWEKSVTVKEPIVKSENVKTASVLPLKLNITAPEVEATYLTVNLDTNLTPELKAEGEARELMRNIQKLRKKEGLGINDQATVSVPSWPEKWRTEIENKTNTTLVKGDELKLQ